MTDQIENAENIIDPVTGDVLGTVSGSVREDLGMISTSRYEKEQLERNMLLGLSFPTENITEEERVEIVRKVLTENPDAVLDVRFNAEIESAKESLSEEIGAARAQRVEQTAEVTSEATEEQ